MFFFSLKISDKVTNIGYDIPKNVVSQKTTDLTKNAYSFAYDIHTYFRKVIVS